MLIPDSPAFALYSLRSYKVFGGQARKGLPTVDPNERSECRAKVGKAFAVWEGPAAYQLVGKVTAYQGYDG